MFKQEGFTLLELIITLSILCIITAISLPATVSWRENASHRKVARDFTSALTETRSRAIKANLEHRLEIDLDNDRFRMAHGNRAAKSTASSWEQNIVYDWTDVPAGSILRATSDCSKSDGIVKIHFNPLGSANSYYICILDSSGAKRFQVGVPYAATGQVVIRKWQPDLHQWK